MIDGLSDKLRGVLKDVRGQGTMTEKNVTDALRQVRLALLEADVNFAVVKDFIAEVKKEALGEKVLLSVTPGQQFTKVVNEELTRLLGSETSELELKGSPAVIMLVGLQGSGKTTTSAKLAARLKSKGRSVLLVPADLARPAAVLQLQRLSDAIKVDCFDVAERKDPFEICKEAVRFAGAKGYDTVILDTAGRLHVDETLMGELKSIKEAVNPVESLFVADAMTGQDAVSTAKGFNEVVGLTGVILTKLDSDARGGAALSMRMTTGVPIKFVGTGEKMEALDVFHPERLAGRILGMGDVLTLVEKAQENIDEKEAVKLEQKLKKDTFTLEDFKDHLGKIKSMGSIESILSMIPGFDAAKKTKNIDVDETQLVRIEAIIDSMTPQERRNPGVLNSKRRIRIAKGSGTKVQDINKLIKQYAQMRKMMKRFTKSGMSGLKNMLSM
ncbi:MAG: signal recognition particle protein [Deltaproteobacteria bacterium]|nr:signal recognition particle protein [Deltaproteobacteria bacterium]